MGLTSRFGIVVIRPVVGRDAFGALLGHDEVVRLR